MSRYGGPITVTTDHGRQLESNLFRESMTLLGVSRIHITAYHPSFNEIIERFHRSLKTSLCAHRDPSNWISLLRLVLLGLHTALKFGIGYTPQKCFMAYLSDC